MARELFTGFSFPMDPTHAHFITWANENFGKIEIPVLSQGLWATSVLFRPYDARSTLDTYL